MVKSKTCSNKCCCCHQQEETQSMAESAAGDHSETCNNVSVYYIKNLDCADCAAKLEKELNNCTGINKAVLNFGLGKLTIEHEISESTIIDLIHRLGYQAEKYNSGEMSSKEKWWQNQLIKQTGAAGVCYLAALFLSWQEASHWMVVGLYFAAMIVGGWNIAKTGLYGLFRLNFDMNTLMLLAVVGAAALGEWSEGAAVVVLFSLGNVLQTYTLEKTRTSIQTLMKLAPKETQVIRDGIEVRLSVEEVKINDIAIIRPGERIAVDGVVNKGKSYVNQAEITGESVPVFKQQGDTVYAGTLNEDGLIEVRITKLAQDSTLSKIIRMVEEAQADKAPIQQWVDQFAQYYTPVVIIVAALVALAPWMLWGQPFEAGFYKALVLLVIACPCALVISTPVSIVAAIGNASRNGVLIKGGAYLEQIGRVKAAAFDKTGTLTKGETTVTDIVPLGVTEQELIDLAISVEAGSTHPLAKAILAKGADRTILPSENHKSVLGLGAQADINGYTVYIGSTKWFKELGYVLGQLEKQITQFEQEGKTTVLVGKENEILGMIAIADQLRPEAEKLIEDLRKTGISKIIMLTGDKEQVAEAVAAKLCLNNIYSELMPEDKMEIINRLKLENNGIVMIGDGVNDAPALASASVSVAMGAVGSDTALETADIALMSDELNKLPYIIRLSRKTLQIVKENIGFALAIKIVFVMGTLLGYTNLWLAIVADSGAAILVTLNGMRLLKQT